MKRMIFFLFFFFSPLMGMICHSKYQLSLKKNWQGFEKYLQWMEQEKQTRCGSFRILPGEIVPMVMSNLNYKSNMRFIMTCRKFYNNYVHRNDILFTDYYLDYSDYTDAMIHFSRKNDKEKVKLLMKHEGSINKKNREEIYEWHWKSPCSDYQRSDYQHDHLIHNTIKIYQMKYPEFNGPLSVFSIREIIIDKNALLELMLKQGFDLNWEFGWDHYTPLQQAVKSEDVDYLKALLGLNISLVDRDIKDVDRNIQDGNGDTALHRAVLSRNIEILRLLSADSKVDCNIRNNQGKTAYDHAKSLGAEFLAASTFFSKEYRRECEEDIKNIKHRFYIVR